MDDPETHAMLGTRHKTKRTTTQKTKKMSNIDPTRRTHVLATRESFLFLIKHSQNYYSQ
jgi:hypothetical protein